MRPFACLAGSFVVIAAFAACSSASTSPSPTTDAAAPGADASTTDAAPSPADAAPPPDAAPTCSGACRTTTLEGRYGAKTAAFSRAQHGWDKKGGAVTGVTVEAHFGGAVECPKQASPTPDRTLIVSGIPVGSAGRVLTLGDGLAVTLLDFKEALTSKPLDKATSAKLTVVAIEGDPPENVVFDLEATFEEGTIRGHAFAEHCTTMDE